MALTLNNKKWYPLIFSIGCAIVFAVWWRFPNVRRPELLLPAVGGVGGFTYFFYRQHLDETKLFKELFTEFNSRYDALNDHLNMLLSGPSEGDLSPVEKEYLFSYFNLCAEEYLFYEAGYIDRRVWESWYRGMGIFFDHPHIRALWEKECKADSFYGIRPPPQT